jgi:hypothetical protein
MNPESDACDPILNTFAAFESFLKKVSGLPLDEQFEA